MNLKWTEILLEKLQNGNGQHVVFIICEAKAVHLTYFQSQFYFLFVVHYLLSLAGLDSVTPTEAVAPLHMVRSPPCLYRSAKQIKALSQTTFARHLHNSRTRTAEAITVHQSKLKFDVK